MLYSNLLLDLDGTVYPNGNGIWQAIANRMEQFMLLDVGLEEDEIPTLREEYYRKFGTTLGGLRKHHNIDELDYLRYVHDIPINQYLKADPKLRSILSKLPQKKWIFTNSDKAHSKRVLTALNILDLFDGILDIETFNFMNKPNPVVYKHALKLIGNPPPNECIYIDDSVINLVPAKNMGIITVHIGEPPSYKSADYSITKIQEITNIPGIFTR